MDIGLSSHTVSCHGRRKLRRLCIFMRSTFILSWRSHGFSHRNTVWQSWWGQERLLHVTPDWPCCIHPLPPWFMYQWHIHPMYRFGKRQVQELGYRSLCDSQAVDCNELKSNSGCRTMLAFTQNICIQLSSSYRPCIPNWDPGFLKIWVNSNVAEALLSNDGYQPNPGWAYNKTEYRLPPTDLFWSGSWLEHIVLIRHEQCCSDYSWCPTQLHSISAFLYCPISGNSASSLWRLRALKPSSIWVSTIWSVGSGRRHWTVINMPWESSLTLLMPTTL